ncbi:MAG: patatin-like phospholipase family protein [Candidatus Dormibacteria bacterium]
MGEPGHSQDTVRNAITRLPHPRVLLLSGGGANGSAQAAAVLTLMENGYEPDAIVGTSIGAWNGAYLATHPGLQGARQLVELWRNGAFTPMARPSLHHIVEYVRRRTPSLIGARDITEVSRRTGLSNALWKECNPALILGAVNLNTGSMEYWNSMEHKESSERLVPYVAASSALVPLQPIASINGVPYADGGFRDNYGVQEVLRILSPRVAHASLIIIDAAPSVAGHKVVSPQQGVALASGLIFRGNLQKDIVLARHRGYTVDVIPVGGLHGVTQYLDPKEGVNVGKSAVEQWGSGQPVIPVWKSPTVRERMLALTQMVKPSLSRGREKTRSLS